MTIGSTSKSSILDKLRKNIDPTATVLDILSDNSTALRGKDVERAICVYQSAIEQLKSRLSTVSEWKHEPIEIRDRYMQSQVDHCEATLDNLARKEMLFAAKVQSVMNEFTEALRGVKIRMDLSYQINKINNLQSDMAERIALSSVASAHHASQHLRVLQQSIRALTDIKAIYNEPVREDSTGKDALAEIFSLFTSQPILKRKLHAYCENNTECDVHIRLEDLRPLQAGVCAADAGYTGESCHQLYKKSTALVNDLIQLQDYWFKDTHKYNGENQCRVFELLKAVRQKDHLNDEIDFYSAAVVRMKRLNVSMKLMVMYIYPSSIKELTALADIMDALGVHKQLDDRVKRQVGISNSYRTDQQINKSQQFFKFAQGDATTKHHAYVRKVLGFTKNQFDSLLQNCEKQLSVLNNVDNKAISFDDKYMPMYSAHEYLNYLTGWSVYLNNIKTYFRSALSTKKPIVSWATYEPDLQQYLTFKEELLTLCSDTLDIDVTHKSDLVSPSKYTSHHRNSKDHGTLISPTKLGWDVHESQKSLKKAVDTLLAKMREVSEQLSQLNAKLNSFDENPVSASQDSLSVMYGLLNDSVQCNAWLTHDIDRLYDTFKK